MAVVVFGAIIALSLFVAFMASRGRDVLQIEEYLVGGRSFSGVLLFFLAVGEIYSIGTMVGAAGGHLCRGCGLWDLVPRVHPARLPCGVLRGAADVEGRETLRGHDGAGRVQGPLRE